MRKANWLAWAVILMVTGFFFPARSQEIPAEVLYYPEMVLFNGKIASFEGSLMKETVAFHSAMAVRGGKVFALGSDDEIARLKGPQTLAINLKGRTVLPGFVDPHNHPNEWVHYFRFDQFMPDFVKLVYIAGPQDRYQENRPDISWGFGPILETPPPAMLQNLEASLKKAAAELGPGEDKWILALVSRQGTNLLGPIVNRQWLDQVVPNNPVAVSVDFIPLRITVNTLGIRVSRERDPGPLAARHLKQIEKDGWTNSAVPLRLYIGMHVIAPQHFEAFKQSLRYVMLELAKYGATSIGSRVNYTTDLSAHAELARDQTAPVRMGWDHQLMGLRSEVLDMVDPKLTLPLVGDFAGIGSDLFWNIGVAGEGATDLPFSPVLCTSARVREKYRKTYTAVCGLDPGTPLREAVSSMVANRVRAAQFHGSADKTIDGYMEAVVEGMKRGGLTVEDIRRKRITFDHVLLARPDQVPHLKELGIIPSSTPLYIYQDEEILDMFGPQIESWMFPIGMFVRGGIPVTMNLDRIPTDDIPYFWELKFAVTRNFRGRIINREEAVDRPTALKTVTTWSARYLLREEVIGNLQPGYFADLMVLDQDYFTVPADQIDQIRVLMTVLGGKITWLSQPIEKEMPSSYRDFLHPTFVQFEGKIR